MNLEYSLHMLRRALGTVVPLAIVAAADLQGFVAVVANAAIADIVVVEAAVEAIVDTVSESAVAVAVEVAAGAPVGIAAEAAAAAKMLVGIAAETAVAEEPDGIPEATGVVLYSASLSPWGHRVALVHLSSSGSDLGNKMKQHYQFAES
jgi:hypothetical protein